MQPFLKKVTPLFPINPSLKVDVLSSPPLFENLVGGSTPLPLQKGGGGANYVKHGLNSVSKLGKLSYFLSKLCIFGMDISKNKANITAQDYD